MGTGSYGAARPGFGDWRQVYVLDRGPAFSKRRTHCMIAFSTAGTSRSSTNVISPSTIKLDGPTTTANRSGTSITPGCAAITLAHLAHHRRRDATAGRRSRFVRSRSTEAARSSMPMSALATVSGVTLPVTWLRTTRPCRDAADHRRSLRRPRRVVDQVPCFVAGRVRSEIAASCRLPAHWSQRDLQRERIQHDCRGQHQVGDRVRPTGDGCSAERDGAVEPEHATADEDAERREQ